MAHDVFISYSSKDKHTTDIICRYLEEQGVQCWMAPRNISPGQDWAEAIVDAIGSSKLMLLIFSSNANGSLQINREISVASEENIPVVPFRIEDIQPSRKLKYYLSTPHWLDALPPPVENHLGYLAKSVLKFLPKRENDLDTTKSEPALQRLEETPPPPAVEVRPLSSPESPTYRLASEPDIDSSRSSMFNRNASGEKFSPLQTKILIALGIGALVSYGINFLWMLFLIKSWERLSAPLFFIGIMIGLFISGLLLAFLAKTNPIFGCIAGVFAAASVTFYDNFVFSTRFSPDDMAQSMMVLLVIALIIMAIAMFAKRPMLWIYSGLISESCLVSSLVSPKDGARVMFLFAIVGIGLAIFAAFRNRQRQTKKLMNTIG